MEWIQQLGPVFSAYHGRILLPLAAALLVVLRFGAARAGRPRLRRALIVPLALAALVAGLAWHNFFTWHYGTFVNTYEHFHYHLATRFADELGYFDLYAGALAVDAAEGGWYRPADGLVRDLRTNRLAPVAGVLAEGAEVRNRFSPERWESFTRDVLWFRARLGPGAWQRVLRDHGYNGTPVWTTAVGALTGLVPAGPGLTLLAALDTLLLVAAIAAVWRAFGSWPALLVAIALGSSYLMAHAHMKGALLRTDFAVALVVAVCLLRRGAHATAGVLVGYAALSRIFPLVFAFGIAARAAWTVLTGRRGALARYARFGSGLAVSVAVLTGVSLVDHGGTGVWSDFATKLSMHRERPHIWDLGLATLTNASFDPGATPPSRRSATVTREGRPLPPPVLDLDAARRRAPWRALIAAVGVVLALVACRRLPDHSALAFGYVPLFLLVSPTYYYSIVLLLPLLYFSERLEADRPRRVAALGVAGTAWIFCMAAAGFVLYGRYDQYFPTTYWNAVLAAGLVALMLADGLLRTRRAPAHGAGQASSSSEARPSPRSAMPHEFRARTR